MEPQRIFLRPEYGHPSSLWASKELAVAGFETRAYYLPEDLGIKPALGNEILEWTREFSLNFIELLDSFRERPLWKEDFDRFRWYDKGWDITYKLREDFPAVRIVPQFSHFVFSINERRENLGKKPICFPGENLTGHVSIRDVGRNG
ncbi:hypothetical protein [Corynebacterium liangguodongii]|uniref:hypothetical protein n=1 Tax=Corynebacterium liangguodongii TaxID=2079535 RepID=UPI0011B2737A|nr:hypothetical protein [Corynebacterium liangguodongii]